MIDNHRQHLVHFQANHVREVAEQITITERDEGGQGSATFSLRSSAIEIVPRTQHPLLWHLAEKKCADGAFVTFDDNGAHLHLVELKCKLGPGTWAKVLRQFHGMYLNAIASIRLLQIGTVVSTTCYVAGTEDAMDAPVPTALLKTGVGGGATFGGKEFWDGNFVILPFDVRANLVKAWRDPQPGSVANFGFV
jgi:hypothetical protein